MEQNKRKSRAKHSCSKEMAEAIAQANLLPRAKVLPSMEDLDEYEGDVEDLVPESVLKYVFSQVDLAKKTTLDSLKRDGIPEEKSGWSDWPWFKSFYQIYVWRRENFLSMFEYISSVREYAEPYFVTPPRINVNIRIMDGDKAGDPRFIQFELVGIAQIFDKSDPDRLRTCEICDKFFWAKRVDSATCSTPCLNVHRQRKHREKLQVEKRNEKRRLNHAYKKGKVRKRKE